MVMPAGTAATSATSRMLGTWRRLPKGLRYKAAIAWYDFLTRLDRKGEVVFLNHGFAPDGADRMDIGLLPEDEAERYAIQLYHHAASPADGSVDWAGKDALEAGCGRGGGASYVARYLKPRSLVGLDIAGKAIEHCRRRHTAPNLSFRQGDAQALPFPDESFDIVLNVESSGSYPDKAAFFAEVARVLRPGGHFLFADYRRLDAMRKLRRQLAAMPLTPVSEQDISDNVRRGLLLDDAHKRALIDRTVPWPLRGLARQFAFISRGEGDEAHALASGDRVYISCVFAKPAA
ncbi:SAM-dependent methyltransferase [Constrictibacter sp. MBR-5]|jgi:SAM-dependent methyltransferase